MLDANPANLSRRWYEFDNAPAADRVSIFQQTMQDGLMTPTMATQMAARLHHDTAVSHQRPQFDQLIAILQTTLPDTYHTAGPAIVQWQLLNAILANDRAAIATHIATLTTTAVNHLDAFANTLDMLAYHGETAVLTQLLTATHPRIQQANTVKRQLITELTSRTTDQIIFAHLQNGGNPADPTLINTLQTYFAIDAAGLAQYTAVLTGTAIPHLTAASFHRDTPKEAAANLSALLILFTGDLHRTHDIPFSKGSLVQPLLPAYFSARRTGQLNPREDLATLMQGKRPFPRLMRDEPAHPLCPDQTTLERYLAQLLHRARPQPYRAATLYETLPHWITLLHQHNLITAADAERARRDLSAMRPDITQYWQAYPSDPTLLANLPA